MMMMMVMIIFVFVTVFVLNNSLKSRLVNDKDDYNDGRWLSTALLVVFVRQHNTAEL